MKTIGALALCRRSPCERFDRQRAEPEPLQPDHLRRPLQHQLKLPEPLGLPGRLWLGLWQHLHRRPHRRHELRRHVSRAAAQPGPRCIHIIAWVRWALAERAPALVCPLGAGALVLAVVLRSGAPKKTKPRITSAAATISRKAPDRYAATVGNALAAGAPAHRPARALGHSGPYTSSHPPGRLVWRMQRGAASTGFDAEPVREPRSAAEPAETQVSAGQAQELSETHLLDRTLLGGARKRLALLAHRCSFAAFLDRAGLCGPGKLLAVLAHRLVLARSTLRERRAHADRRKKRCRTDEAHKRGCGRHGSGSSSPPSALAPASAARQAYRIRTDRGQAPPGQASACLARPEGYLGRMADA